jgi:hypothetical protein
MILPSIYDRDVYVPVGFIIMSLGPTGFVSCMNPAFVGGRVHNLELVTVTNQPTSTVTNNVLLYSCLLIHYQLTSLHTRYLIIYSTNHTYFIERTYGSRFRFRF